MSLLQLPKRCPAQTPRRFKWIVLNRSYKKTGGQVLTSLSFMANIIAPACSAAFPTMGSKITLMNAIGIFIAIDAP